MTSCKEVNVQGREEERGVWDKAREKKITRDSREGEESAHRKFQFQPGS